MNTNAKLQPTFWCFIPAHNEGGNLARIAHEFEIILVNDGHLDNTYDVK
jgi:glycosyltransferase involved in cell wall biosynthesis